MKSKKKILIGSLIILILAVALITVPQIVTSTAQAEEETTPQESTYTYKNDYGLDKVHLPVEVYKEEGYDDFKVWWEELQEKRKSYEGVTEDIIAELDGYLSDEEIAALQEKELKIINARCFTDLDQYIEEYETLVQPVVEKKNEAEAPKGYTSSGGNVSSYSGGSYSGNYNNFRSAGVLYDSGYRYTYYSSNVLYHYNTANWDLGDDGIYRENGRVVVASDAYPNGTVLNTEMFGECIVRDCGVGRSDTLDVYTAY